MLFNTDILDWYTHAFDCYYPIQSQISPQYQLIGTSFNHLSITSIFIILFLGSFVPNAENICAQTHQVQCLCTHTFSLAFLSFDSLFLFVSSFMSVSITLWSALLKRHIEKDTVFLSFAHNIPFLQSTFTQNQWLHTEITIIIIIIIVIIKLNKWFLMDNCSKKKRDQKSNTQNRRIFCSQSAISRILWPIPLSSDAFYRAHNGQVIFPSKIERKSSRKIGWETHEKAK